MKYLALTITSILFSVPFLFAQSPFIDSLKLALPSATTNTKAVIYSQLAYEYKSIEVDSSLYYSRLLMSMGVKLEKDSILAIAYNSMANSYEAMNQFDSSKLYHIKALDLTTQLKDSVGMANSYNNLGIVNDLQSRYEQSLEYYFKALDIYERLGEDPFQVAMVLGNIGIVLKKQKEYERVLEYYEKALSIYEQLGSGFGLAVTRGNIGGLYILLKDYEKAISYNLEALDGYRALGYARYEPYVIHNIALARDSLGQLNEAEAGYRTSIKMHLDYQNYFEAANCLINLAGNLLKQQRFRPAIEAADSAQYFALQISSPDIAVKASRISANAYAAIGDYSYAYDHLQNYLTGQDSIFQKEKTKAIFDLETRYKTREKEQQIKIQKAELFQKDLVIERDRLLLIASAVSLLALVGLFVMYRNKLKWKQAKMLEEEMARAKEDQMTAVVSSQEKERNRFAQDIHDGFGQLISVLKLKIQSLKKPETDAHQVYDASVSLIDEMYQELKNICFNLMPQTLVRNGLPSALREFADRINLADGPVVEVLIFDIEERLEDIQEISIYRITQEVVNNILKYAQATHITIQLTKDEDELTLTVEDDGMGFDPEVLKEGKGNGWKNLNARANFIKGELSFDSRPDMRGTTFIFNAPASLQSATEKAPTLQYG